MSMDWIDTKNWKEKGTYSARNYWNNWNTHFTYSTIYMYICLYLSIVPTKYGKLFKIFVIYI